jgi:precorrin-6B methylase 2
MPNRVVPIVTVLAVITTIPTPAQERFSFFQASTPENVQRMLTMAALRDDDVVVDLGSGDGLIPLTAARMNPRLRGFGVDIDAKLVDESNKKAKEEGLADRVRFDHRNAFDADLREATVITMWLFPELMRLLRPTILERARPGTRVLTTTWNLGSWKPDQTSTDEPTVYLWIVPARVAGSWDWVLDVGGRQVRYASLIEQRFQETEGVVRVGDRREVLDGMTLRGDEIAFTLNITLNGLGLTRHEFSGKVDGDQIAGTVKLTPADRPTMTLQWRARRAERSDYFAPTGTEMFQKPAQVG